MQCKTLARNVVVTNWFFFFNNLLCVYFFPFVCALPIAKAVLLFRFCLFDLSKKRGTTATCFQVVKKWNVK